MMGYRQDMKVLSPLSLMLLASPAFAADPIGRAAVTFGSDPAVVRVSTALRAADIGVLAANIGDGAIRVMLGAHGAIRSDGIGISTVKAGDGMTTIDAGAAIGGLGTAATGGDGIRAVAVGESPVAITATARGTIDVGGDGIAVTHRGGGGITIATRGTITAGDDGIKVQSTAPTGGAVDINARDTVAAGGTGILVLKRGDGDVAVAARDIAAGANGITVRAADGTGDVLVEQTATHLIHGDVYGIAASRSGGAGDVDVFTHQGATTSGGAGAILAASIGAHGHVMVETAVDSVVHSEGTAVTVLSASSDGGATVRIGGDNLVEGRDRRAARRRHPVDGLRCADPWRRPLAAPAPSRRPPTCGTSASWWMRAIAPLDGAAPASSNSLPR